MGAAFFHISVTKLINPAGDEVEGPHLAVMCMPRQLQIYPLFLGLVKVKRLVVEQYYRPAAVGLSCQLAERLS
jgi:hypothetical protein